MATTNTTTAETGGGKHNNLTAAAAARAERQTDLDAALAVSRGREVGGGGSGEGNRPAATIAVKRGAAIAKRHLATGRIIVGEETIDFVPPIPAADARDVRRYFDWNTRMMDWLAAGADGGGE